MPNPLPDFGHHSAELVRPYLSDEDFARWLDLHIPLSSRIAILGRNNVPPNIIADVQRLWGTWRFEYIDDDAELDRYARADDAWSDAWNAAEGADRAAGRRYNKETYSEAAHIARAQVLNEGREIKVGMTVEHRRYGKGKVLAVMPDGEVRVRFPAFGEYTSAFTVHFDPSTIKQLFVVRGK